MMHVLSRLVVTHSSSLFLILMQDTAHTCSFRTSTSFWVFSAISQTLTWKPATNIHFCTTWSPLSSGRPRLSWTLVFYDTYRNWISTDCLYFPGGYSCRWLIERHWVLESVTPLVQELLTINPDLVFAKSPLSHASVYSSLNQEKASSAWQISSSALKSKEQSFCNGI